MKFLINYNTGAGNKYAEGTLEEAQRIADEGAAYTQQNIDIVDENDNTICTRRWYGVEFDPSVYEDGEDADVIYFGAFGYYGEWEEAN